MELTFAWCKPLHWKELSLLYMWQLKDDVRHLLQWKLLKVKLFLAIFWYICIYEDKVKSSSLAYNRHEIWDKWLLGRDLTGAGVISTLVKSFFSHSPWLNGHRQQHMSVLPLSLWIHSLWPRKLYTSVVATPAPVWLPTQWLFVLRFMLLVGQTENFSPCQ